MTDAKKIITQVKAGDTVNQIGGNQCLNQI